MARIPESHPDLLTRTAGMLEEVAEELRRSHSVVTGKRGRWLIHDEADRRARDDYLDMIAVARELRRAAAAERADRWLYAKRWRGWAVVSRSGAICVGFPRQSYAIYRYRDDAEADCAKGQRPVRVNIRTAAGRSPVRRKK